MASVKQSLSLGVAGQRSMLLSTLAGVALALLMAVPSRADDVTFLDLTDTLSVSTSSTRISGSCDSASETCVATILAPPGSVFETTAIFGVVFIAEADGTLSDAIGVTPSTDGMSVQVAFVSDLPGIPFGPTCDTVGGCLI